jgi:signal transduction histidine kinase/CheY-like chemotaxis protein
MNSPRDWTESRVLLLAPTGRDALLASRVLSQAGIDACACASPEELQEGIRQGAGVVLVTEDGLSVTAVADLAQVLADQPAWSNLPVLVFSGGEERGEAVAPSVRRLVEVADVTLLDRPTRKVTLISAVRAALRSRQRQYEVRDFLQQLEQGVRERDQFLAMLGHELRNPLEAILTSVQLMEQKDANALVRERTVIHRQTRLLSRLVDDLLDVSRVTSGKIVLKQVPVDLRELVERCVQGQAVTASAHRIELTLSLEETSFLTEGDPMRLEQIVNNLLTNALKYTPSGGHVAVTLAADGPQAEIRVKDTGVGIEPTVLPHVFDLFTQAESTLERAQGGLGIGLTLVRSLVALHGGTVRAESSGRGEGSTFVIRLPLTQHGFSRRPEEPPRDAPQSTRRILLVEDNRDVREGLKSLLEEEGHEVWAAGDGVEGVELALIHPPEVALVDIGLPRLDGYAVARSLREAHGPQVLLIALTGYGLPEDRRRAFESGFDAHLIKPVTLNVILDLLEGDRRQPKASLEDGRPGDRDDSRSQRERRQADRRSKFRRLLGVTAVGPLWWPTRTPE